MDEEICIEILSKDDLQVRILGLEIGFCASFVDEYKHQLASFGGGSLHSAWAPCQVARDEPRFRHLVPGQPL